MQPPEAPAARHSISTTAARILLVDDLEANLLALESCLEELGENLVRAKSAQEALRALLQEEFALVLLDVRMPDMDGFELARLIRQQERLKEVPIIFVSAVEPRREDLERAYELGVVDYVVKPVAPIVLKTKARVFVELYRSRTHLARRVAERTAELEKSALTLRTSEARLRILVDQVPAVQWTTDTELRITMSVGSGLAVLGLKPGQLVGTLLTDFVGPDDPSVAAHRRALAGQSASYEGGYSGRQFETNLEPLRDDQGTVVGVVGVSFDRTERRAAEQTVRLLNEVGRKLASELDLEKLVQSTTDVARELVGSQFGAFFYNVQNEKAESYLLYTLSGVPREAFSKFPMPRNTAIFAPTFSGQGVVRSDDIRKDPRYGKSPPHHGMPAGHLPVVSYLAVPVVSRTGEVLGGLFFGHGEPARFTAEHERLVEGIASYAAVAIENARLYRQAQDEIARRRLAEDASAFLGQVIRSSNDAVVTKTLEGRITSWNAAAERIFGWTAEEAVGRPITILIPEDRLHEEKEILARIGRGEEMKPFETVRRRKDGRLIDVSVTVSPVKDQAGRIIGASKVTRDITESKQIEAKIRQLNADLERRVAERTASLEKTLQELNSFAYTVAHDLRAPLRSMHQLSELLIEDYSSTLDPKAKGFLERIAEAAGRMDALTRDILEYSRLTRAEVKREPVELGSVLREVLSSLHSQVAESGAKVEIDTGSAAPLGSRLLLTQALTNLVQNALKFVPPGVAPRVRVRAESRGERVRIWVDDNGIGIDPAYHGKLFQVFERVGQPGAYPGTGIGLAIVRKAAERMGGEAGVVSKLGEGSRFWIELPGVPS